MRNRHNHNFGALRTFIDLGKHLEHYIVVYWLERYGYNENVVEKNEK